MLSVVAGSRFMVQTFLHGERGAATLSERGHGFGMGTRTESS